MDKLYSIDEIFEKRFFRIPDFQRGYAWRADKEVREFWEDIVNLDSSKSHYTGQITLEKVPNEISQLWNDEKVLINNSYKPMYIVDGQQRVAHLLGIVVGRARRLGGKVAQRVDFGYKGHEVVVHIFSLAGRVFQFRGEAVEPALARLERVERAACLVVVPEPPEGVAGIVHTISMTIDMVKRGFGQRGYRHRSYILRQFLGFDSATVGFLHGEVVGSSSILARHKQEKTCDDQKQFSHFVFFL